MFLPGESQGRGNLVGFRLWGRTESDTNEATYQQQQAPLSMGLSRQEYWRGLPFPSPLRSGPHGITKAHTKGGRRVGVRIMCYKNNLIICDWLWRWKGPMRVERRHLLEVGQSKEKPSRKNYHNPTVTLIFAHGDPSWTSDLQNHRQQCVLF